MLNGNLPQDTRYQLRTVMNNWGQKVRVDLSLKIRHVLPPLNIYLHRFTVNVCVYIHVYIIHVVSVYDFSIFHRLQQRECKFERLMNILAYVLDITLNFYHSSTIFKPSVLSFYRSITYLCS